MWSLKNKINKQYRNKIIDAEEKLIVTRWDGGMRGGKVKGSRSTNW